MLAWLNCVATTDNVWYKKTIHIGYMINDKNNPIVKPELNQELAMKIKTEQEITF